MFKECKYAILVLLYGKKPEQSLTLRSLREMDLPQTSIHVVNNGPAAIADLSFIESFNNASVHLDNRAGNRPLSVLYNQFIDLYYSKGFSKFVILDDDTSLNSSFLKALTDKDASLVCPLVIAAHNNQVVYPKLNDKVWADNTDTLALKGNKFYTIGSGLILSAQLVEQFKSLRLALFDENFAFYGVDSTFFKRLMFNIAPKYDVFISKGYYIEHDLSLAKGALNERRLNEVLWDKGLTLRHYPSSRALRDFTIFLISMLKRLKLKQVNVLLKAFFVGRHPRCNEYISNPQAGVNDINHQKK